MSDMSDPTILAQTEKYLRSAWRRRWHGLGIAVLCCGVGWSVVGTLHDRYESSATVYADLETLLSPLMKGLSVEINVPRQIDFLRRTLLSRPNVEKIIIRSDLDHSVTTPEQKESLIQRLAEEVDVEPQGHNLFRIQYGDSDPYMARRVVQSVVSLFIENHLGARSSDMRAVDKFLGRQIEHYARQLDVAEHKLAGFKKQQMGYLRPRGIDYFSELINLRDALSVARAKRQQAESRRAALSERLATEPAFLEKAMDFAGRGPIGPDTDDAVLIFELQAALDHLRARFTDQHPDVVVMRRRLADAQRKIKQQLALATGPEAGITDVGPQVEHAENPVHTRLQIVLAETDAELAALKTSEQSISEREEKWQKLAQTVPNVEAELMRLTRDYQIIKERYEALRQRQESAKMASEIARGPKVDFRVVEPPQVPLTATWPNRPLLFLVVLFFGIGAGIGIAILTDLIDSRPHDSEDLKESFILPVLHEIPLSSASASRRSLTGTAAFCCTASLLPLSALALIIM